MYCIYLTVYSGNKLPPFYIGYSTVDKVKSGYKGTVQSNRYKTIFKEEVKHNPSFFKTFIVSICKTRGEALKKESNFQRHFSVHKNPMYINMAISNEKFYCTDHSFKKAESYREGVSQRNRERWDDPVNREQLITSLRKTKGTEEWRKGQSERSKKMAEDPVYIESLSKGVKASWEREGEKERRSKIMKIAQNSPECTEKRKQKKWWTDGTTSVHSEICPPGFSRDRTMSWKF